MLQVVDKTNFDAEVLEANGLVFVDFWSPTCTVCTGLMPDIEALAEKNADKAKFCKLDTSGNRRLAISQKVMGLPTLVIFKGGERVAVWNKEEIDLDAIQAKLDELAE